MKKSITILIAVCLLCANFSGCTSSKHITFNDLDELSNTGDYLVLHTEEKKYKLYRYQFTESKLKGDLQKYTKVKGAKLHVYTSVSDDLMKGDIPIIDFEISDSDITKIKFKKVNIFLTSTVVAGGIVVLFLLLGNLQVTGSSF